MSLQLNEIESQCLSRLLSEDYNVEEYSTDSGKLRGIVRGVRVTSAQLIPNGWNYNTQTDKVFQATGESLSEFGQVEDLVVRPHPSEQNCYQIIGGEHRSRHLRSDVYVNVLFGLTESEAKKLTIVLNETKGSPDDELLSDLLLELSEDLGEEFDLALPWNGDELEDLMHPSIEELDREEPPESIFKPLDTEWFTLKASLPKDAYNVFIQAAQLVEQEVNLPRDKAKAFGTVIEYLSADYLSR